LSASMRAVVRGYGVEVVERPLPAIQRGWVLVKVLSALWSGVEDAVFLGIIWPRPGVVMGCMGYGVVVELGSGAPGWLSGKRVVVGRLPLPYTVEYTAEWMLTDKVSTLPGILYDGWLAEYVALPASSLTEAPLGNPIEGAMITPASIAAVAARLMALSDGDYFAVIGAGVTGILTALAALERYGVEVELYTDSPAGMETAGSLGLQARPMKELKTIPRSFDAVFISTLEPYPAYLAASLTRSDGEVILHPIYSYLTPPRLPRCRYRLVTRFPGEAGAALLRVLGRGVVEELAMVVKGLEVPTYPRPKPGIIYLPAHP